MIRCGLGVRARVPGANNLIKTLVFFFGSTRVCLFPPIPYFQVHHLQETVNTMSLIGPWAAAAAARGSSLSPVALAMRDSNTVVDKGIQVDHAAHALSDFSGSGLGLASTSEQKAVRPSLHFLSSSSSAPSVVQDTLPSPTAIAEEPRPMKSSNTAVFHSFPLMPSALPTIAVTESSSGIAPPPATSSSSLDGPNAWPVLDPSSLFPTSSNTGAAPTSTVIADPSLASSSNTAALPDTGLTDIFNPPVKPLSPPLPFPSMQSVVSVSSTYESSSESASVPLSSSSSTHFEGIIRTKEAAAGEDTVISKSKPSGQLRKSVHFAENNDILADENKSMGGNIATGPSDSTPPAVVDVAAQVVSVLLREGILASLVAKGSGEA